MIGKLSTCLAALLVGGVLAAGCGEGTTAPSAQTNAGDNSRLTSRWQARARMGIATDARWQTDYGMKFIT